MNHVCTNALNPVIWLTMHVLETWEAVPRAVLSMDFMSPTDRNLCPGYTANQLLASRGGCSQIASRNPHLLILTPLFNPHFFVCVDWTSWLNWVEFAKFMGCPFGDEALKGCDFCFAHYLSDSGEASCQEETHGTEGNLQPTSVEQGLQPHSPWGTESSSSHVSELESSFFPTGTLTCLWFLLIPQLQSHERP